MMSEYPHDIIDASAMPLGEEENYIPLSNNEAEVLKETNIEDRLSKLEKMRASAGSLGRRNKI